MFSGIILDLLVLGVILWGVGLVAIESYWWSVVTIVGLFAGLWFLVEPVKNFVLSVGWKVLLLKWLPIYIGVGIAIAGIKWTIHVAKTASKVKDSKENFKNSKKTGSDDPDVAARRKSFVTYYAQYATKVSSPDYVSLTDIGDMPSARWQDEDIIAELLTPRAKNHIDRISFWIIEWPYVVLATVVSDFLLRFTRWIARLFDSAFTKVSRLWIGRVVKDI